MNRKNAGLRAEKEGVALLNKAFDHFDLSASKLQNSYVQLQHQVSTLNLELEKKNEQLELNLKEKEKGKEYLNNILESLNSGVVVVDEEGKVTTFNRAAELITGIAKGEVEGEYFIQVLKPLLPDDFPIPLPLGGLTRMSEGECKLKRKDGKDLRLKISGTPLRMKGKKREGGVIIFQDITRLKKLEEQAERTNRLAAMGEIAVSIAHEVRNPLGSIELLASLLRREIEDDEEKRRLADHILAGVKNIDYVINNLLLFTRPQHPILKKINLHAFLDEALHFVVPSLKQSQIELSKRYNSFDPLVLGDSELLKQVVLNLVWNAIQAMPQGGKLIISTEIVEGGAEFKNETECLKVKFIDSGVGISNKDKKKIFNPFFTTKEKGTGLGLAIVNNIIEIHEGMIEVESSVGQGATFAFVFPLVAKEKRKD